MLDSHDPVHKDSGIQGGRTSVEGLLDVRYCAPGRCEKSTRVDLRLGETWNIEDWLRVEGDGKSVLQSGGARGTDCVWDRWEKRTALGVGGGLRE